jgi:hypothetical protein
MAEVSIFCPHCQKHTALSVAQTRYPSARTSDSYVQTAWRKDSTETWWIGICNSCKNPVLVLNNGDQVYPHPLPTPTDANIPKELADDLNEAKLCFSTDCYRACAVMARRCIQTACILKGAKKTDLVGQIAELAAAGLITKDIEEWATVVRWIGNDAAHPGKDIVNKEDAEDSLELAEQFLHVIFVTPAVAKARRAARGK